MPETEKQKNNPLEINTELTTTSESNLNPKKKNKTSLVIVVTLILFFAVGGFLVYKNYFVNTKNINTQIGTSSPKLGLSMEEIIKIQRQNTQAVPLEIPENFPKEYIPVKYNELSSVLGTPNNINSPYGIVLMSTNSVEEKYTEAKEYYLTNNWNITELKNREDSNSSKKFVADKDSTAIITTVNSQNNETFITLNIISKSDVK